MKSDEHRELAFTYGLGRSLSDLSDGVKVSSDGKMRLFVPQASLKKPFVAAAYIKSSDANQTVTLKLPAGLSFAAGQNPQQTVPPAGASGYSQVTWKLTGAKAGTYIIEAEGPKIGVARERAVVNETTCFGGIGE
jgi:hypothetical protein